MHTYVFKHSCPHYSCNEPHIWLFVFLMAAQCCGRQTYGRHSDHLSTDETPTGESQPDHRRALQLACQLEFDKNRRCYTSVLVTNKTRMHYKRKEGHLPGPNQIMIPIADAMSVDCLATTFACSQLVVCAAHAAITQPPSLSNEIPAQSWRHHLLCGCTTRAPSCHGDGLHDARPLPHRRDEALDAIIGLDGRRRFLVRLQIGTL